MRRKETPADSKSSPKAKAGSTTDRRTTKPSRGADASKRETLNLRIKLEDRSLIDRAASLSGKSRTDFLLEAGRRAATDALLDRSFFLTNASTFAAFAERLDAPPGVDDRLRRMLQRSAPWDK